MEPGSRRPTDVRPAADELPPPSHPPPARRQGSDDGIAGALQQTAKHRGRAGTSLSGSFATVALNAGAFLGPLLAGIATATTHDYRDAAWVSAVLAATAAVVIVVSRRRATHADVTEAR